MMELVLILLGLSCLFAGAAVSQRYYAPLEQDFVTGFVGISIVFVVIHVLGWLGILTAASVAAATLLSSAVIVRLIAGTRWRETLPAIGKLWWRFLGLPFRAIRMATKAPGVGAFGMLAVLGVLIWTAILVWLAPSNGWDGQIYLEPIVYYAIQNAGFELVDLVRTPAVMQANTAPKGAMYLSLWAVIFAGKTWVEWAPHAMLSLMVLGSMTVARRFGSSINAAAGWAAALFLVPAFLFQLRSTYVDAATGAAFLFVLVFLTVPKMRTVDAVLGALALGILGATKHTGIILVPLLALPFSWRVLRECKGHRRWQAWLVGVAIVLGLQAPTYVRNAIEYDNPLYPRRIHKGPITWDGPYNPYAALKTGRGTVFKMPVPGKQYFDTRDNGYGNLPPFVIPGLVVLALCFALWFSRREPEARWLLAAVAPAFVAFALSPGPSWARYNVAMIVAAFVLSSWLFARLKLDRLSQLTAGALILAGLATLYVSEPVWCADPEMAVKLFNRTPAERAASYLRLSAHLTGKTAMMRDAELKAGDVVGYTWARFPARMWNDDVSNHITYTPWSKTYLDDLDRAEAKWVFVKRRSRADQALTGSKSWTALPSEPRKARPERIFRRKEPGSGIAKR